ncbi:unnamed protein product [Cuscuta epithymum]|uniref:MADS-box domain-containing protein n=1 Tax=Cuscuta epithymum TaxID=186058 RepID=A0AAV0DS99_9ASTE|nr:unnamed protein product [Cuscuta epithymum]
MANRLRKMRYERRAASIIKKTRELETLCNIKLAVVIVGPDGKTETWPPDPAAAKAIFDAGKENVGRATAVSGKKRNSPEYKKEEEDKDYSRPWKKECITAAGEDSEIAAATVSGREIESMGDPYFGSGLGELLKPYIH